MMGPTKVLKKLNDTREGESLHETKPNINLNVILL